MNCPHCEQPVFRKSADGAKLKARTSILVLHKSGALEFNCPSCKLGVTLPVQASGAALQKAETPRFVVRKT